MLLSDCLLFVLFRSSPLTFPLSFTSVLAWSIRSLVVLYTTAQHNAILSMSIRAKIRYFPVLFHSQVCPKWAYVVFTQNKCWVPEWNANSEGSADMRIYRHSCIIYCLFLFVMCLQCRIKRRFLTKVKLTALYKQFMTKTIHFNKHNLKYFSLSLSLSKQ